MQDTCTSLESVSAYQKAVEYAYAQPRSAWDDDVCSNIHQVIALLNAGTLRIMTRSEEQWTHHGWLQKAILCYFKLVDNQVSASNYLHYKDKIPSRFANPDSLTHWQGRLVPPTHVRYGSYIGNNCVLMPCFVNIGAYVDDNTMVDTWATVGAGAQIGKSVHISGGAGIGGILEPPQAKPTIIEDDCFIGARSEIAEGVVVQQGAVIAMGTFISQSTRIYDRTTGRISYGMVPRNAVVVPGSVPAKDGTHSLQAAVIVKYADAATRKKVGINGLLRENM